MRAINVLLSILVSLVIGLFVFEGGLRVIGYGPPATLTQFDAHTGWGNKANYRQVRTGKEFGPIHFGFNSLGLRDDSVSTAKANETYRVIMLGDSFTLGYTVERDELFVDLLEKRWRAEGRKVEVLNVGTIGWSTDQQAAWLLAHGEEYDPDMVVVLPYDNDVFWCSQSSYTGIEKPTFDAEGKLASGKLTDTSGSWKRSTALGRLISPASVPMFKTSGGRTIPREFGILLNSSSEILGDSEARARGALTSMRDQCEKLGAQFVLAPIPSNSSVDSEFASKFGSDFLGLSKSAWSPDRALEFFLDSARDLGIRSVDARDAMKAAHANNPCYFDYFGEDHEWHFNASGNLAFANFLHAQLSSTLPGGSGTPVGSIAASDSAAEAPESGLPFWAKLYLFLWVALTALYFGNYSDEAFFLPPIKVGLLLAVVFATFIGVSRGIAALNVTSPTIGKLTLPILVGGILLFVAYKLGNRIATILELIKAFILRGHWYLMPLVVVLLSIGSLLVVAASSPLVAPFIYTLF